VNKLSFPRNFNFCENILKLKIKRLFFDYYFTFGTAKNFVNHTGLKLGAPCISKCQNKFIWLMEEYKKAKSTMDFDLMSKLKRRRIKLLKRFS